MVDQILLQLQCEAPSGDSPRLLDAAAMRVEDWIELAAISSANRVEIRASKSTLAAASTYFNSVFHNFREAGNERLVIDWDPATVLCILQRVFTGHLEITPSNIVKLLEGAVFFGCDNIISECEAWVMSDLFHRGRDIIPSCMPSLFQAAEATGSSAIAAACVRYLAINFDNVLHFDLSSLPESLLTRSLDHPALTVSSERQLADSIRKWSQQSPENFGSDLLSKVRAQWLPVNYPGKRYSVSYIGTPGLRLTQYTKELDLSGCVNVTGAALFYSVLCGPFLHGEKFLLHRFQEGGLEKLPVSSFLRHVYQTYPVGDLSTVHLPEEAAVESLKLDEPSLRSLRRLNLSECWEITERQLLHWIQKACSELRSLTMKHAPQVSVSLVSYLGGCSPRIEVIDLERDLNEVDRCESQASSDEMISGSGLKRGSWGGLRWLVELSIAGHYEVSDLDLQCMVELCPSLIRINVSGCSKLTDTGMSSFLKSYRDLRALQASCTGFGKASARDLHGRELEVLVLDHCRGLSSKDLVSLLSRVTSLAKLSLSGTTLTDKGLLAFTGASLEFLRVCDTQVSGAAIAFVLRRNLGLKHLNLKDCKGIVQDIRSSCEGLKGSIPRLEELKAGWGFSDYLESNSFPALRKLSLGLGAETCSSYLYALPRCSPLLEELSLCFQNLGEEALCYAIANLPKLSSLKLRQPMEPLSSAFASFLASWRGASNLTRLELENVCPSLAMEQLRSLAAACRNLTRFSLTGCKRLDSEALEIISRSLIHLSGLKLENCSGVTNEGVNPLLNLKGLRKLVLRHNGVGLPSNVVQTATDELPLLRSISLDKCDAIDTIDTPKFGFWGGLATIKLTSCRTLINPFIPGRTPKKFHKHTTLIRRASCNAFVTSTVQERL